MSSIVDQLAHQIALVRLPPRRISALWGGRWVVAFYPPDWDAGPPATPLTPECAAKIEEHVFDKREEAKAFANYRDRQAMVRHLLERLVEMKLPDDVRRAALNPLFDPEKQNSLLLEELFRSMIREMLK